MSFESIIGKGFIVTLINIALILFCLTNFAEGTETIPPETVLAEYKGGVFTKADYDAEYYKLPFLVQSRFSTRDGRREFLQAIVLNHLLLLKAVELGIDRDPETFTAHRDQLKPFYAGIYRKKEISGKINISADEAKAFYQNNLNRYAVPPQVTINHIMTDNTESVMQIQNALQSQLDLSDIVSTHSINRTSRRNGGVISNITGNGFVPGVGRDVVLSDEIMQAPLYEWLGPLTTETGIHFFQVVEHNPGGTRQFEEVRDDINSLLQREGDSRVKAQKIEELRDKYEIVIDTEKIESLNMLLLTPYSGVLRDKVVTGSIPEFDLTVWDLYWHFSTISPYIINDDMTSNFEYYSQFRHLPREEWQKLSSPESVERLVNNLIEVNLLEYEARQLGYEDIFIEDVDRVISAEDEQGSRFDSAVFEHPEVQQLRRHIILQNLFQEKVIAVADPTPSDIKDFYEESIGQYTLKESRSLRFFLFSSQTEAREARNRVLKAIEDNDEWPIINLIRDTDYPQEIRAMQFVERDPVLQVFGEDRVLYDTIWSTPPGELSEVNETTSGLFYFLVVLEHNPEYIYPQERVEERIAGILTFERRASRWRELVSEILAEYEVKLYPERLFIILSPEELFTLAEQSQIRRRYVEAVQYYDQIIDYHKNGDDDYRALFAKAFLLYREMSRQDDAAQYFKQLLADYPAGALHESAQYILDLIDKEN